MLSYSQLATFKKCPQKHFWLYEVGLRRKTESPRLWLGSTLHECLAAYYRGEPWEERLSAIREQADVVLETDDESVDTLVETAWSIMSRYVRVPYEPWTVVEVEQEHRLDAPWGPFVYRPDLLVRDRAGDLWLVDHKTLRDFPSSPTTDLTYDDQIALYLWALRQEGVPVVGAIHNYLRTRLPKRPAITKNGRLSRQAVLTDEYTVREMVAEGLVSAADAEAYLAEMPMATFFFRAATDHPAPVSETLVRGYVHTVRLLEASRAAGEWPRTFSRLCPGCPVRELCQAALYGIPEVVDDLRRTLFVEKAERDSAVEDTDEGRDGDGHDS